MNDITAGELILAIIISIIFFLAIYGPIKKALRNRNDIEEMKLEAISRGYAEWVINPTNGVSTWQWK